MAIVNVSGLSKVYNIAVKEDGLVATLKHFWHRQYRPIAAVKDISFEIESGEMVGFLGANGAGKTTTLKMLTGLFTHLQARSKSQDISHFGGIKAFCRKLRW